MACSKSSRQTEGLVTQALDLDIVIDRILEYLPICIAAKASVLSKQWRRGWLSLKSLVFSKDFWDKLNKNEASDNWIKTISNILLYHKGPVGYFELQDYFEGSDMDHMSHSPWLSFLSKNGIKKLLITHNYTDLKISPYIFCCSELVHLKLQGVSLCHPPTDFCGHRNLKHLDLIDVSFARENSFLSLVANCSMLAFLSLERCFRLEDIVIDLPSLKTLRICDFELQSIAFRNVRSLECISLCAIPNLGGVHLIDTENLANSAQLQSIELDGFFCEFLVAALAGGNLRSLPVKFEYLNKLCLSGLESNDLGLLDYILRMLESCPYITMLDISFIALDDACYDDHNYNYNYSHQLAHLREIKINGIIGSSVELKLIEHLLAVSIVLEKVYVEPCHNCDMSPLKISIALNGFPRASTKARIVFLDQ